MKKENEPVNSRREILAGMGLAALGLVGLKSVWQKLSFDDNTSTRNSNINKFR